MKSRIEKKIIRTKQLYILVFSFSLLFWINMAKGQFVNPYQPGTYAPGLASVRDYSSSEPGFLFLLYTFWGSTNSYYNRNGEKLSEANIDLSQIDPSLGIVNIALQPEVKGLLVSPVVFYTSNFKILGARWLASVSLPILNADYKVYLYVNDLDAGVEGNTSGIGDITVMPFGLSWSFGDRNDLSFTYTLTVPSGRYDTDSEDNIGQGFWTHQFQLPTYFYALEKAFAFTLIPTLELNSKVVDADLRAGNRFTLEYGIGQYLNDWLEIGIVNGHNWQISDDSGDDFWWRGSFLQSRDRKSTLALGIGLWPVSNVLNIRLKYTIDYGLRQRFKNNIFGLSFLYIPGSGE